jgi:hypothetical protein
MTPVGDEQDLMRQASVLRSEHVGGGERLTMGSLNMLWRLVEQNFAPNIVHAEDSAHCLSLANTCLTIAAR